MIIARLLSSWSHRRSSPTLYLVGRARTTMAFTVCCLRGGGGVEVGGRSMRRAAPFPCLSVLVVLGCRHSAFLLFWVGVASG